MALTFPISPSLYREAIALLDALPILVAVRRDQLGWSLRYMELDTGVPFNTISRVERGEHCDHDNTRRLLDWLERTEDRAGFSGTGTPR